MGGSAGVEGASGADVRADLEIGAPVGAERASGTDVCAVLEAGAPVGAVGVSVPVMNGSIRMRVANAKRVEDNNGLCPYKTAPCWKPALRMWGVYLPCMR